MHMGMRMLTHTHTYIQISLREKEKWAGEMIQQLKASAALVEDL